MPRTGSVNRSAEVKDMASQVQRELDQTRQELRRGVLDLPQETSETAEAMRRVVSDQIRALKELAALVSDSGATFDVAEPRACAARRRRSQAGAFREAACAQPRGSRRVEVDRRANRSAGARRRGGRRVRESRPSPMPERRASSSSRHSRGPDTDLASVAGAQPTGPQRPAPAALRSRTARLAVEPARGRFARRAGGGLSRTEPRPSRP